MRHLVLYAVQLADTAAFMVRVGVWSFAMAIRLHKYSHARAHINSRARSHHRGPQFA